jgi:hypothetical protein
MISSKLTVEFSRIRKDIQEAYVGVGMITQDMFDFFIRGLGKGKIVSIVIGVHMPTSPGVFKYLKEQSELKTLSAKIFTGKYFHPKLYLFKLTKGFVAFVGSGNFTAGGWVDNEELFVKISDEAICVSLQEQFGKWYEAAVPITEKFLALYEQTYASNKVKDNEARKNVQQLIDSLQNNFNIENVDFKGQFFTKEHHLAFAPGKTHLDTPEIIAERGAVRNRLYELNDLIINRFNRSWNLHPHYRAENIVANLETHFHHEENVKGLWIAYGRSERDLKKYGFDSTPLHFMRMQVILGYDYIGTWLMPGKSAAGQIDREFFLRQMENEEYKKKFFSMLTSLGKDYWIEIANKDLPVTHFQTPDDLKAFVMNDNWRYYYFIIGRNYPLGTKETQQNKFPQTVLDDFSKYYPLYELIRDKSFDNISF